MSEALQQEIRVAGKSRRIRLLYAMLALLVLGPMTLGFLAARPEGVEWLKTLPHGATVDESLRAGDCRIVSLETSWSGSALEDADLIKIATTLNSFQMTVVILVVALGLLYLYPLGPILRRLVFVKIASVLVAVEVLFMFWLVYGGMASMGMPGLFWNEGAVTEMMAAVGVSLFGFWMLYLLFVRDFEAYRHTPDRRIWTAFSPVLERSGLPRLLRREIDHASADEQLGWFLGYAGIPLLVLLALPGVLPAPRPLKVASVVEWPWLAGLVLGTLLIAAMVWARVATRLHVLWTQLLDRRLDLRELVAIDPDRLDPHANLRNIWLILTGIFLISYIPFVHQHKVSPAAFSICVMLGVLATFSIWLSMMRRMTRVLIVLGVLTLLALTGGLDYEVTVDDLAGWYPSASKQIARRLSANRLRPHSYGSVVDLADYQRAMDRDEAKDDRGRDHRTLRREGLDRWRNGLRRPGEKKPILVVVTTSGGALRAAIWTEVVLKEMERAIPEFPRHIRLITGASGGMLGAADYVAELAASGHGKTDTDTIRIGSDYLSPIAWQIAFRDFFPNSLMPWATYNRGQASQDAWCKNSPRLGLTFGQLKPDEDSGRIPSIVFSPMMVEDGRRLLISNLPLRDLTRSGGEAILSGDAEELRKSQADPKSPNAPLDAYDLEYPDTASVSAVECFEMLGGDSRDRLRLASAVRMSATFPYVTSAVVLPTDPPRHIVDAGYYDNYGVNLAASWIASHGDWIIENTSGVLVVQIRAFRNEKRLKLLDEEIHSPPKPPEKRGRLSRWMARAGQAARFLPEFVSLVQEGVQSVVIPVEGVAKARESSMFFRNDEQLFVLQELFRVLNQDSRKRGKDSEFFRTEIFTCDTLQFGQASQNVETLNWYIDTQEFNKIRKNMKFVTVDPNGPYRGEEVDPNGRDRNALRLQSVKSWWHSRSKP